MPHKQSWRTKCNRKSELLWKALTLYREGRELSNISLLLDKAPDVDQVVLQWARANVPNISIGGLIIEVLGEDDPAVIKWRSRVQRTRKQYLDGKHKRSSNCAYKIPSVKH
jgi:hypothetical protein|tara:strand:+ start:781 stop:1113 length:333 start_codon:yes stop_codon:yes gene_type:complete